MAMQLKLQQKTKPARKTADELDAFFSDCLTSQSDSEIKLKSDFRKRYGVFLTNKIETIDNIIDILSFDETILEKRILEPACGRGIFLIRILLRLYEAIPKKTVIGTFIQKNLVFVDIDPLMIQQTKVNIENLYRFLFDEDYCGSFNGFVQDFTQKSSVAVHSMTSGANLAHFLGRIDYVVGNPPYVTLYGRRDKKVNEEQRIYYLKNFEQFPSHVENGKINFVMLFLEHSLDFLKKEALLSFIIDVSFFETAYKHTRKYLLENTRIMSLDLNISDFDVASSQLIVKLRKGQSHKHAVQIRYCDTGARTEIPQVNWYNPHDEFKFRINNCEESSEIIQKLMSKVDRTLLDLYPNKNLRTCTMLLDMEARFTSSQSNTENKSIKRYPYYQGSKSLEKKFCQLNHFKYFDYDKNLQNEINARLQAELAARGIKNKKRIGLGEDVIYDNPKLFIRQSAKSIICTVDFEPSAANNSLYVFSLRDNTEEAIDELLFVCGWLNSELMTFYAQQKSIIRFSKGKIPQIKISDLHNLIVSSNSDLRNQISRIVRRIYNDQGHADILASKIDDLIYAYFQLRPSEIAFIKNKIMSF